MSNFDLGIAFADAAKAQTKLIRWTALFVGLLFAVEFVISRSLFWEMRADEKRRLEAPASNWYQVDRIAIDDAKQFDDPVITRVDREFKFDGKMTMKWDATVFNKHTGALLCFGSGSSANYSKQASINLPVTVLGWWLDRRAPAKQCVVWPFPPGETCLATSWQFTPEPNDFGPYPRKTARHPDACWNTIELKPLERG